MARSSHITGTNPRPNPGTPSSYWETVQKQLKKQEARFNKARGGEKGRTMGNVKKVTSEPPIRLPGGGVQK